MLRNTRWVYGAVIYTGHQSKVMMNATAVPSKRSSLERRLDLLIVIMFAILAIICTVGAIGSVLALDEVSKTCKPWIHPRQYLHCRRHWKCASPRQAT